MLATIVIVNFNGRKHTLTCIESLLRLRKLANLTIKIIMVDNASEDGLVDMVEQKYPQVMVLQLNQNTGFTGGNNKGIRASMDLGADYVLLINNDTLVDQWLLVRLLGASGRHQKAGVLTPKIYFAPGYEFHKQRYKKSDKGKVIWSAGGTIDWQNMYGVNTGLDEVDKGQFDEEKQTEMASGCCMLLTRGALEQLNGFDERYFMYYEDVELSFRARSLGWQIWYVPRAKIWHVSSASAVIGSNLADYFVARNRMLTGLRFAPIKTKLALIKESVRLLISGRPWQKQGIKDYYLRRWRKGSWQA